jgi:hypothetical protein
LIGSPHPLQFPFAVVGRRTGLFSGAVHGRSVLRDGDGDRRPPWIAGSMGDSGESMNGSSFEGGWSPRAYCLFLGGDDVLTALGFSSAIDDSKLAINTSTFVVSDGCRSDRPAPVDRGGLEVELALLASLYSDAFEDWDSEGVWYGFPIPNSAARFRFAGTGGASPSLLSTLDLIKLAPRGGRGLERSGPENDCFRALDLDGDLLLDRSMSVGLLPLSFDGLRICGPGPGSDGLLIEGP